MLVRRYQSVLFGDDESCVVVVSVLKTKKTSNRFENRIGRGILKKKFIFLTHLVLIVRMIIPQSDG